VVPAERDYAAEYARRCQLNEAKADGRALPHGQVGLKHDGHAVFAEEKASLKKETEDRSKWVYRKKGKILGGLFAVKMAMWKEHISGCPLWGTDGELDDDT
jgi:hypothetical protein